MVWHKDTGTKTSNDGGWRIIENHESLLRNVEFSSSEKTKLKGPFSPLDVKIRSLTKLNKRDRPLNVRISQRSINYVLLDQQPEIDSCSLVVGHKIEMTNNQGSEKNLILNNTCLLPKIKGLISRCLLMFSPTVELRIDEKNKKYCGALCGLGYDRVIKRALYAEDDIEDVFEIKIDHQDLREVVLFFRILYIYSFGDGFFFQINSVRMIFNNMIGNEKASKELIRNPERLKKMQRDARDAVMKQLKKKSPDIEPNDQRFQSLHDEYKWNRVRIELSKRF